MHGAKYAANLKSHGAPGKGRQLQMIRPFPRKLFARCQILAMIHERHNFKYSNDARVAIAVARAVSPRPAPLKSYFSH